MNVVTSHFLDARKRVQDQIRQEMMMTLVPLRSRKIISVAYGANATATPIPPTAIPAPTSAPVVSEPTEPPRTLIGSEVQGGDTDFNVDALVGNLIGCLETDSAPLSWPLEWAVPPWSTTRVLSTQ